MRVVIVGGGPSGLTAAYLLGRLGHTVTVVDAASAWGGCHRVTRVSEPTEHAPIFTEHAPIFTKHANERPIFTEHANERPIFTEHANERPIFTEHGPRMYSSNYVTLHALLRLMDIDPAHIFTRYKFNFTDMAGDVREHLTLREAASFAGPLLFRSAHHTRGISVAQHMSTYNFSERARAYIDRLCRLTDGASAERYTLWEFLMLVDQSAGYHALQPTQPNDAPDGFVGSWVRAIKKLESAPHMRLHTRVHAVRWDSSSQYYNVVCHDTRADRTYSERASHVLLCVPPVDVLRIKFVQDATLADLPRAWAIQAVESAYITYISMTFEWQSARVVDNDVWGFPGSDWGIAWVILSDYFQHSTGTLISCAITMPNARSSHTGKTANETSSEHELLAETFRQLGSMVSKDPLQRADGAALSPRVQYDVDARVWVMDDSAFVLTPRAGYLSPHIFDSGTSVFANVLSVGPHTGSSPIGFTTAESAVASAVDVCATLDARVRPLIRVRNIVTLTGMLRVLGITLVILLLLLKLFIFK